MGSSHSVAVLEKASGRKTSFAVCRVNVKIGVGVVGAAGAAVAACEVVAVVAVVAACAVVGVAASKGVTHRTAVVDSRSRDEVCGHCCSDGVLCS